MAHIAAGSGDHDQVFEWLKRAEDLSALTSLMYPMFKDLHADPRFEEFRQRLGRRHERLLTKRSNASCCRRIRSACAAGDASALVESEIPLNRSHRGAVKRGRIGL